MLRKRSTNCPALPLLAVCALLCCRLGIEEPTWDELYGNNGMEEGHPFDDYFCKPGDDDEAFNPNAAMEVRQAAT